MPKFVRVREGAWEYTIPEARVTDGVKVLDKDAVAANGKPLEPKQVTPMGTPAAGSKQERRRTAKKATPKTPGADSSGKDAGQTSADTEKEN